MTGVFREKLDGLHLTVRGRNDAAIAAVATAMTDGAGLRAVAVGSGGSLASAHFLATCRRDVSPRPTQVETPLDFVLGTEDLSDAQVWLFTGRGDNPDILAAVEACRTRGAREVRLITSNPAAQALKEIAVAPNSTGHVFPVADEKDGFLSTHSLVATVAGLLLATDRAVDPFGAGDRGGAFEAALAERLRPVAGFFDRHAIEALDAEDALILLADPALRAAAVTIETSIWETALSPVQRTDLRNFAHGRHVWLARRGTRSLVLALTTDLTADIWSELSGAFPEVTRTAALHYGTGGRFAAAIAIVDALAVVGAIGDARGVDPGKPGAGPFAKAVYEGRGLVTTSSRLNAAVRHKIEARRRFDQPADLPEDLHAEYAIVMDRLAEAAFRAVVLDYDGTIVHTHDRFVLPSAGIVEQFVRLLEHGVRLGIATGRGGSAGERLREVIPARLMQNVVMGYYNGGYVQPLDIDIRDTPPPASDLMDRMREWVDAIGLPPGARISPVQISIDFAALADPGLFMARLRNAPLVVAGDIVLARSMHSVDIIPKTSSKLRVIEYIQQRLHVPDAAMLRVGDSGHPVGNDFDLLGKPFGLSVDQVCHRPDVCWSLFGANLRGPDALLRILQAAVPSADATFRLDIASLRGPIRM